MISTPTYAYPDSHIGDGNKVRFLQGTYSFPTSSGPDDWSALTAAGQFNLARKPTVFALVVAGRPAEVQFQVRQFGLAHALFKVEVRQVRRVHHHRRIQPEARGLAVQLTVYPETRAVDGGCCR